MPGSWPHGGRDVAIFNYWGNETDYAHASTPTTGSGVVFFNQVELLLCTYYVLTMHILCTYYVLTMYLVFFNQTRRAKAVLTAWAEAMAWHQNERAPDDQVCSRYITVTLSLHYRYIIVTLSSHENERAPNDHVLDTYMFTCACTCNMQDMSQHMDM